MLPQQPLLYWQQQHLPLLTILLYTGSPPNVPKSEDGMATPTRAGKMASTANPSTQVCTSRFKHQLTILKINLFLYTGTLSKTPKREELLLPKHGPLLIPHVNTNNSPSKTPRIGPPVINAHTPKSLITGQITSTYRQNIQVRCYIDVTHNLKSTPLSLINHFYHAPGPPLHRPTNTGGERRMPAVLPRTDDIPSSTVSSNKVGPQTKSPNLNLIIPLYIGFSMDHLTKQPWTLLPHTLKRTSAWMCYLVTHNNTKQEFDKLYWAGDTEARSPYTTNHRCRSEKKTQSEQMQGKNAYATQYLPLQKVNVWTQNKSITIKSK